MDYPNGFGLWGEHRAKLLRGVESHQRTGRLPIAVWERSVHAGYRVRIRTAPRMVGEAI